jgi:hypothetical protein
MLRLRKSASCSSGPSIVNGRMSSRVAALVDAADSINVS